MRKNKTISVKDILKVKELLSKNSIIPVDGMLTYSRHKGEFVPTVQVYGIRYLPEEKPE